MVKPTHAVWDCGNDRYGRRVTLEFQHHVNATGFVIKREPANQRDEPESVALLSVENLRAIAAAAEAFDRG